MLRQISSRNKRATGFKAKRALQICVLVAVSVWLLYQIKHSRDKKEAFDERNPEILEVEEAHSQIFKLGRKDLTDVATLTDPEPEMDSMGEEKEEAEEIDNEVKQESEDGEGKEDGDELIDEHDQEGVELEEEGKISNEESKDGAAEETDTLVGQEHEDGSQEARERTFKGDDASSAVTEDTHAMQLESKSGGARNLDGLQYVKLGSEGIRSEIIAGGAGYASDDNNSSIIELKDESKTEEAALLEKKKLFASNNLSLNKAANENRESEKGDSKLDTLFSIYSTSTSAETDTHMERQTNPAATQEMVAISNQMEVPMNSTAATVSSNDMERQSNASMVHRETNGLPSYDNISIYQNATVELETPAEDSFITSTVDGDTTLGESSNYLHNVVNGEVNDAHVAASTLKNIQSKVESSEDEASE